jgi:hypothetical protein
MMVMFVYAIFFKYPQQNSSPSDIFTNALIALSWVFLIAYPTFGMFLTLVDGELCRIDFFFIKKHFPVSHIVQITYPPTFIAGRNSRTLTIIADVNGETKQTSMSYPAFTEQTLAKAINDLRRLNPGIRLNEDAEALLEKFAQNREVVAL